MGQYIRDEIKFHNFFNSVRKAKGVSLTKVCYGLCSDSMMHYIENGERLPDFRMRNRIMSRLGISSEEYEDFVQYDEFDRWKMMEDLMGKVEEKNVKAAESLFEQLINNKSTGKIEKQILFDIRAKILMMKGASYKEIENIYHEAIEITLPEFNFAHLDNYMM